MSFKILKISAITGLLMMSSSLASASQWEIKRVAGENPYCTMSRSFNQNIELTIAKNNNQEGSIALSLLSQKLNMNQPYMVRFNVDGAVREFALKPASRNMMIVRIGRDPELFNALATGMSAKVTIDSQTYDLSLVGSADAFRNMSGCVGETPMEIATKTVVPPQQPLTVKNDEIAQLLTENRRLTQQLTSQRQPVSSIIDNRKTDELQQKNSALLSRIANLEAELQQSSRTINPDMRRLLDEKDAQVSELMKQNIELKQSVLNLKNQEPQVVVEQVIKEVTRDVPVVREVIKEVPVVQEIIREVPVISDEMKAENAQLRSRIASLQSNVSQLSAERDSLAIQANREPEVRTVVKEVEVIKEVAKTPPQILQQNQNMQRTISQLEQDLQAISVEKKRLETAMANQKPEVIVKEIIKEVPVSAPSMTIPDSEMGIQLAEIEVEAQTFKAERDEFRRLLQIERRRMNEKGNVAGQINVANNQQANLVADVRRLEKEKVELIRQLEFAKTTGQVVEVVSDDPMDSAQLNTLSLQLSKAQKQLQMVEAEKTKLEKRMAIIDREASEVQRQLAESTIQTLSDDSAEAIEAELNAKTMRAEIAALEAQNKILQSDMMADRREQREAKIEDAMPTAPQPEQVADVAESIDTRPLANMRNREALRAKLRESEKQPEAIAWKEAPAQSEPQPQMSEPVNVVEMVKSAPIAEVTQQPMRMVALSGDEIKQLVAESRIPLMSSIDRVDRVSGPDFAAFKWDTGVVYGSGEQSRMNSVSAFDQSVTQYIQRTASRCQGSFDQNLDVINTANGMSVKSADIACVDDNANGSAASILFFTKDDMFYALAHEANMDTFQLAMDMRDRLMTSIDQVF